eukprot:m.232408 g.232408  ORF g.232408 m.232408 type:complete len:795 (+) comp17075_c13_seq1:234-2618(+)
MKFGDHLFNSAVPEWRPAYVNYKQLKKKIKAIVKKYPRQVRDLHPAVLADEKASMIFRPSVSEYEEEDAADAARLQAVEASEEEQAFLAALNAELDKVNTFSAEQMIKISTTRNELEAQLTALYVFHQTKGEKEVAAIKSKPLRQRVRATVKVEPAKPPALVGLPPKLTLRQRTRQLKKVFQEYYRNLDLLRAYRALNNTAFYKITKKHDKNTGLCISPEFSLKVKAASFMAADLDQEIRRVEKVYTERLEHGDRRRAMQKLRVPDDVFQPFDWTTFGLGLFTMFFFFCMAIILIIAFRSSVADYPQSRVMFAMYRGLLYPLIMLAFVAINMYVWRKFHVNYILIFGLDHRHHTNHISVLGTAGFLLAIWSISVFIYLFQDNLGAVVAPWSAFGFFCFLILFWINPFPPLRSARYWLARVIARIVTAPLTHVNFEDFWLADQFNSLVVVLLDLEFIFCYILSGQFQDDGHTCRTQPRAVRSVIAALPATWRLLQCLRRYWDTKKAHHLHNGLKYTSSIIVVVFSTLAGIAKDSGWTVGESSRGTALFVMWILACTVNTSYAMYWDFKNDWGLFAKGAKKRFLRKDMLYPSHYYYLAMVNNFIFRLSWTFSISVGYFDFFFSDGLVAMVALGEMWRRFCWNFFRVENEHLNNCGEFRAVRVIPMPFEYAPAESHHGLEDDDEEDDDEHHNSVHKLSGQDQQPEVLERLPSRQQTTLGSTHHLALSTTQGSLLSPFSDTSSEDRQSKQQFEFSVSQPASRRSGQSISRCSRDVVYVTPSHSGSEPDQDQRITVSIV